MLTWLRENRDGPYWRHGSVRSDASGNGYDRIDCPVMIVAGWADGYRNNSFRTVEALRRGGCAAPAARRSLGARRPGHGVPRAADRPRPRDGRPGGTGGCAARRPGRAAPRPRRRVRAHLDPARAGPRAARGPLGQRRLAVAGHPRGRDVPLDGTARRSPSSPTSAPRRGSTAPGTCRGGCPCDQRDDDAHSLTWEWAAASRVAASGSRGCGCGSAPTRRPRRCRSSSATSSPTAPRRWSRAAASTSPTATGSTRPPSRAAGARPGVRRGGGARRVRLPARARSPAAAVGGRRGLAEHRRAAGAGHAHRAQWLARAAVVVRQRPARPRPSPPARRRPRRTRPASPGR